MKPISIQIDQAEALRYAGHRNGALPASLQTLLDACCAEVQALARPRMVARVFPVAAHDPVRLAETELVLEGADIAALLDGVPACALMAVTIGGQVEAAIRRAQVTDMSRALFLDACASAAVESVCEACETSLRQQLGEAEAFFTRRYSPGYGDLPLTMQRPILQVLDAGRRIGLSVSESGLLTPRKSVTAVLGISPSALPQAQAARGCAACSQRKTCLYRKEGNVCAEHEDQ